MCTLQLTEKDRKWIEYFSDEQVGVLLNVEPHLIDESEGVILVTCSDGDQMADVFRHHEGVCKHHRDNPRIHMFALNGGAKLIADKSPLKAVCEDEVLLHHIQVAKELKEIATVALYVHAPCGAAYSKGLSFLNVLELLFEGKDRVKEEISGIKVACFCHVDYGNGRKRTYFVSREAWKQWKSSQIVVQKECLCYR